MLGGILGDIAGSRFERRPIPVTKEFEFFHKRSTVTDDSILSIAIAKSILTGLSYEESIRNYYNKYPFAGYGSGFKAWANDPLGMPYESFGNGSAMRVSPVGWVFDTEASVLEQAEGTAKLSHNHPEGIKGAQAVALAIFLARQNTLAKEDIGKRIQELGYEPFDIIGSSKVDFDVTCQVTVPQAMHAFLETDSTEDAIRMSVMMGGDTDTIASIAGAIAHAFHNDLSQETIDSIFLKLPWELADVVFRFSKEYVDPNFSATMPDKDSIVQERDEFVELVEEES